MTTGVLYLVSACSSPEEFVAAFRRYTDRIGLFVPTATPVSTGKRGRLAITLKDGGVMIEGEAEVVSSSTRASALYGRVGMTIRFVATDDASKAVLDELDKARIAPKPLAEGIAARPADVPDSPRAEPPAVAGRIDAANALAECVVIGDVGAAMKGGAASMLGMPTPASAMPVVQPPVETKKRPTIPPPADTGPVRKTPTIPPGPPPSVPPIDALKKSPTIPPPSSEGTGRLPAITPPKAAQKFVVPSVPPVAKVLKESSTTIGPMPKGPAPATPTGEASASDSGAVPIMKRPTVESAPVARPPSEPIPELVPDDESISAPAAVTSAPVKRDPTPPPSRPTPPKKPVDSTRMTMLGTPPVIAPAPVSPAPAPAPAPAPSIEAELEPADSARPTVMAQPLVRPGADPRATVLGGPPLVAPALPSKPAEVATAAAPPPVPPAATTPPAGMSPRMTVLGTPPVIAPAPVSGTAPAPAAAAAPVAAPAAVPAPAAAPGADLFAISAKPEAVAADKPLSTKSTQPTAVVPPPIVIAPSQPKTRAERDATLRGVMPASVRAQIMAGQPVQKQMWEVVDPDERTDLTAAPTAAPDGPKVRGRHIKVTEPPIPSEPRDTAVMDIEPGFEDGGAELEGRRDRTDPGARLGTAPETDKPEADKPDTDKADADKPTDDVDDVSGDWTMTPDAPAPVPLEPIAIAPKPKAEDDWTKSPTSGSEAEWAAKQEEILSSGPPQSTVVSTVELSSDPKHDPPPVVEDGPKIQIDPTLIEALPILEEPALGTIPPDAVFAPQPPHASEQMAVPPVDAPQPMPPMMTPAPLYAPPARAATPLPLQPVIYTPVGQQVPPIVHPQARMVTDGGTNWFRDSQAEIGYRSEENAAIPASDGKRRRLIVIVVSAVVAVAIGLIVLLAMSGSDDDAPAKKSKSDKPGVSDTKGSDQPAAAPDAAPTPQITHEATVPPPDAAEPPADAAPTEITACYANVTSEPAGADISIDNGTRIAKAPARIEIPCGKKVKVYFRMPNMSAQSKTVTGTKADIDVPTVTLSRATFTVKINSTPTGAAISINGKSSGVTPNAVTLPGYDTVTVTLSRDGFETETRKLKVIQGATLTVPLKKKHR